MDKQEEEELKCYPKVYMISVALISCHVTDIIFTMEAVYLQQLERIRYGCDLVRASASYSNDSECLVWAVMFQC